MDWKARDIKLNQTSQSCFVSQNCKDIKKGSETLKEKKYMEDSWSVVMAHSFMMLTSIRLACVKDMATILWLHVFLLHDEDFI